MDLGGTLLSVVGNQVVRMRSRNNNNDREGFKVRKIRKV